MTGEIIFSFVVLLISTSPIIILGMVQYRSKEPVGFWAGKKPPRNEEITDVRAYNRKHGLMWILYGAGFIVCFVCGTFLEDLPQRICAWRRRFWGFSG